MMGWAGTVYAVTLPVTLSVYHLGPNNEYYRTSYLVRIAKFVSENMSKFLITEWFI